MSVCQGEHIFHHFVLDITPPSCLRNGVSLTPSLCPCHSSVLLKFEIVSGQQINLYHVLITYITSLLLSYDPIFPTCLMIWANVGHTYPPLTYPLLAAPHLCALDFLDTISGGGEV